MITAHSDHVGSLLRPGALLRARERYAAGASTRDELAAAEDAAVEAALSMQASAGCEIVTDGEFRRVSFQSIVVESAGGFGAWDLDAFLWGEWHGEAAELQRRSRPRDLGVVGKLERVRFPAVEEYRFAASRTDRVLKVTLPSPSLLAGFWSPERSRHAYPTLDPFLDDVTELVRGEAVELARSGCRYLQLDAPHYPLLIDERTRAFYERQGWSAQRWLERGIELDNAVIDACPGATFGVHLCRGNQGSRWLVAGSYETIAGEIFRRSHAARLLLEYDDERSGNFAPLRHVPDDKTVVLGLVTTKSPRLEDPAELARRVRDAARYVDRERLALSPQCGFSSSIVGNALTIADQAAKLRLVAETARAIWG